MFYPLIKNIAFNFDPERIHDLTISSLSKIRSGPLSFLISQNIPEHAVEVMGLKFKNPIGLAAGLDKNGECIDAFSKMGFGFIEVGTVTPKAQPGNPKPRLFRIKDAEAIINRMGFNNKGVDNLIANVIKSNYDGILGINIGKNKDTPLEKGKDDYISCLKKVYDFASYITVNISSPNTPNLRDLQYGQAFDDLIESLKMEQMNLNAESGKYVPLVIKIAPDVNEDYISSISNVLIKNKVDGVIATNTTIDKSLIEGLTFSNEEGGLSGRPLLDKSNKIISRFYMELKDEIPIIGVGGIDGSVSAKQKIQSGAKLVQLYSSFIYQGPSVLKSVIKAF